MSSSIACPYDVGAPSTWLSQAGLIIGRKACAVPFGLDCGKNQQVLNTCCLSAIKSQQNTTSGLLNWTDASVAVCALPNDASKATYQNYQDCILNYQGRDGGFRCNDLPALNQGPNCNSLSGAIGPPVTPAYGTQACVTGAVANSSALMESCCGSAAVAFEGGCWQYCVGPANRSIGRCIQDGLRAQNLSQGLVGCLNGSRVESGAVALEGSRLSASTVGFVVVLASIVGFSC